MTFFNEETGFAVLKVKSKGRRDLVTVIGSLPSVTPGEWLTAEGYWVHNKEHGFELRAQKLRSVPPTTREGIERYLAVLIARQDLYAAQQQLIEVRFARLANLADLYRALGGGWRERTQ